jgi:hypothetical protein
MLSDVKALFANSMREKLSRWRDFAMKRSRQIPAEKLLFESTKKSHFKNFNFLVAHSSAIHGFLISDAFH